MPQLIAFGRRTLRQQCITSMAFICRGAQGLTPAATIGRINADLEVDVVPTTATGRPTKAKKPRHFSVTARPGKPVARGIAIVMRRFVPGSRFNRLTGGRWALPGAMLPKGSGTARDRQTIIKSLVQRMTLARHSSTHFLQHGWAPAIKALVRDPDYWPTGRNKAIAEQSKLNPLNSLSSDALGSLSVTGPGGDSVSVTAMNNVGDETNAALAKKHREALIEYGAQPLQAAVEYESSVMMQQIEKNLEKGFKQHFNDL